MAESSSRLRSASAGGLAASAEIVMSRQSDATEKLPDFTATPFFRSDASALIGVAVNNPLILPTTMPLIN